MLYKLCLPKLPKKKGFYSKTWHRHKANLPSISRAPTQPNCVWLDPVHQLPTSEPTQLVHYLDSSYPPKSSEVTTTTGGWEREREKMASSTSSFVGVGLSCSTAKLSRRANSGFSQTSRRFCYINMSVSVDEKKKNFTLQKSEEAFNAAKVYSLFFWFVLSLFVATVDNLNWYMLQWTI